MYLSKWWTLTLVTVLLFAAGCGSSGGEAQKTVDRLYRSMQTGDSNAYLDTILPENRLMPNPMSAFGIFGAIFANLGLGDFGLGLNLGSLMESVSQYNPKFEIDSSTRTRRVCSGRSARGDSFFGSFHRGPFLRPT